jgi:hypothetical protein
MQQAETYGVAACLHGCSRIANDAESFDNRAPTRLMGAD